MTFNLYATEHCPRGVRCEACGTELGLLQPWAVRVVHGVLCLTMCPPCTNGIARNGVAPPIGAGTAERLIDQHAGHLQITRHEMALVLTEEDRVASEQAAAALLDPDPGLVDAVVNGAITPESGHGVRPPFHEHVYCSVCTDSMVHVTVRPGGKRVYAAHPMIVGEPGSGNCSNTDFPVGSHRGQRPPVRS